MSDLNGARVVVTGGAGFIGSHLVDHLLGDLQVAHVHVLDDLSTGKEANLAAFAVNPALSFTRGDIRDGSVVPSVVDGADVVFHLACLGVRHSLHDPIGNHDVNASGSLRMLEFARAARVSRYVHVSTSEVYGTAQHVPMDESHPTRPETVYGASKLAGESYARAYERTYGLPTIVVRPFNTYGPRSHYEGDSGEVIPRTVVRLLCGLAPLVYGDGLQTRDFTNVRDTARGIALLASSDAAVGQTVNVGSGSEITINELCRTLAELVDRPDLVPEHLEARPGDVRRLLVDPFTVRALADFSPTVRLDDGLSELVAWFRSQPQSPHEMLRQIEDRNWLADDRSSRR